MKRRNLRLGSRRTVPQTRANREGALRESLRGTARREPRGHPASRQQKQCMRRVQSYIHGEERTEKKISFLVGGEKREKEREYGPKNGSRKEVDFTVCRTGRRMHEGGKVHGLRKELFSHHRPCFALPADICSSSLTGHLARLLSVRSPG